MQKKTRQKLISIFAGILVASIIFGLINTFFMFSMLEKEREIQVENNINSFRRVEESYKFSTEYINKCIETLYNTSYMSTLGSNYLDHTDQDTIDLDALQMAIQLQIIPNIHSAYVYNGYFDKIIELFNYQKNNGEKSDVGLKDYIVKNASLIENTRPVFREIKDEGNIYQVITFFYIAKDDLSNKVHNVLAVNMKLDWLLDFVYQSRINSNRDYENLALYSKDLGMIWSNQMTDGMIGSITKNYHIKSNDESFDLNYSGQKFLCTKYHINDINVDIISIQQKELLYAKKYDMFLYFIFASIAFCIISGMIIYIINIQNLIEKHYGKKDNEVHEYSEENRSFVEQIQIKGFLQGNLMKEDMLPKEIIDSSNIKRLVMISIDHYKDFEENNSQKDIQIVKYGIMKIFNEILQKYVYKCSINSIKGMSYIILAMPLKSDNREFCKLLRLGQSYIKKYYNITISIAVSDDAIVCQDVPKLYQQVNDLSKYNYVLSDEAFITSESETVNNSINLFEYPQKAEDKLTQNISAGQLNDVKETLSNIIQMIRILTPENVYIAIMRLILAFTNSLEKNRTFALNHSKGDIEKIFSKLSSLETIDELYDEMCNEITKLEINKEKENKNKQEKLYKMIDNYIIDNYSSPDLGVALIGQKLNLSPEYVGKIFKSRTGFSVPQYINKVRIDAAIEFLKENKNISEVSDMVGIPNYNYFFRVFKQNTGRTPRQYISEVLKINTGESEL